MLVVGQQQTHQGWNRLHSGSNVIDSTVNTNTDDELGTWVLELREETSYLFPTGVSPVC
jgi:hypothetical protein